MASTGETRDASTSLRLARAATRVRSDLPLAVLDVVVVCAAYLALLIVRFDGDVSSIFWTRSRAFVPLAAMSHVLANWVWGLYGQMWRHASVVEARRVLLAGITAVGALLAAAFAFPAALRLPVSVIVLGGTVTTMLCGGLRFHARLFAFNKTTAGQSGLRVGVVGAGEAGAALVREMLRDFGRGLVPVAVFDDDPHKQGLSLGSVPVVGGIDQIATTVDRFSIHQLIFAIPSADGALVRRVAAIADGARITMKVLPPLPQLLDGKLSVHDVRDLRVDDLLGRPQVEIDLDGVSRLLRGRTVLVTGAGGSIGSEIVRQVADFEPGVLVMLDHDETHLHDAATSLPGEPELVLADIRDADHLDELIALYRPEVVFHAAAHKHVPLLERHPSAAVTTNVVGTANLARSAARHGVENLVFISSDKAVRPASVMGATKWLGEQSVLQGAPPQGRWCAVRFGNVLGSRGSVIPTFVRQIEAGGPVTVTDARMTRFFMSVTEAVRLVLQASAYATGGEIFMLEMGEPVKILDLAERMIRLSGRDVGTDIAIKIIGRRPGEKLAEELHTFDESAQPTAHPSIVRLDPTLLPADVLRAATDRLTALARVRRDGDVATGLFALCSGEGAWPADHQTALDLRDLEISEWSRSTT